MVLPKKDDLKAEVEHMSVFKKSTVILYVELGSSFNFSIFRFSNRNF